MPHGNTSRRLVLRLLLFTLAGWLLWALGKDGAKPGETASAASDNSEPTRARAKQGGFSKRRLATTLAFTTLFFAGAALSAGAGDQFGEALEGSDAPAAESTTTGPSDEPSGTDTSSDEAAPPSDPAPEPTPEPTPEPGLIEDDGTSVPPVEESGEAGDLTDDPGEGGTTDDGQGDDPTGDDSGSSDDPGPDSDPVPPSDDSDDEPSAGPGSRAHAGDPESSNGRTDVGLTSDENAAPDLEFDNDAGYGVVWLHRTLPDPTPPAKRLAPRFAGQLVRVSRANHVDWALVLGVLRAQGRRSTAPATPEALDRLASSLRSLRANADEWRAVLALSGRTAFADRAVALTRYNRAVGLRALVRGLQAEREQLEDRVLSDRRIAVYVGGRLDVANHRINVRVLVLMLYMAESHGQVTVSSLDSGHRLYARPGVVSAHKYGLAVDIAGLEGQSILGHQEAGGLTERAVRNILLLPVELRPKQVISLLGLGGPSFPLANHYDHIHVGY